jgi:hypothetical protein
MSSKKKNAFAGVAALIVLASAMQVNPAFALDGKVYSPKVVKGEAEIEYAGTRTFDSHKDKNDIQENQFSIGYGFTDYWKAELYLATFQRGPGQPQDFTANEFENVFQFWPIGENWVDAGLLASYHLAAKKTQAPAAERHRSLYRIGQYGRRTGSGFALHCG